LSAADGGGPAAAAVFKVNEIRRGIRAKYQRVNNAGNWRRRECGPVVPQQSTTGRSKGRLLRRIKNRWVRPQRKARWARGGDRRSWTCEAPIGPEQAPLLVWPASAAGQQPWPRRLPDEQRRGGSHGQWDYLPIQKELKPETEAGDPTSPQRPRWEELSPDAIPGEA